MVISPKRILWATDFSDLSLTAGKYARGFCEVFGAELHVLHVCTPLVSPDVAVAFPTGIELSVSDDEVLKSAQAHLKRLIADQLTDLPGVQVATRIGNPWSEVCRYADENGIDLIIVATHGSTGLRHVLIGSTAERVVQHARCPVLTVKSNERDFTCG
jgi:nucleotide-binding universal stress UspA family protein